MIASPATFYVADLKQTSHLLKSLKKEKRESAKINGEREILGSESSTRWLGHEGARAMF